MAFIVHPALGGLDTTKAPSLLEPNQLTIADNIEYFTSGSRKKRLGTTRYNATVISGTPTVTALADFWRHGTSLTPTQKFVAAANTTLYRDDQDGVWDSILTSWGSTTANVDIEIAQGYAVFANDLNERPQRWDQTTMADLTATGNPRFAASTYHLRRLFTVGEQTTTAGAAGNPSRTTISAAGAITDFTGGDATSFVIDDDDGDRLIGISKPFRNRLYYFKGPNSGSIHELTGATLSGMAINKVVEGAPCIAHAGIITTPNDIFWASRYGLHSLQTTQKFGDTEEAFISRPIQSLFNDLNFVRLNQCKGFYHPTRNVVGWFFADGGQSENTVAFVYNYILGTWARWFFEGFNTASAAVMIDPAGGGQGVPRLYMGGYDGFVYEGGQATLTDGNGSAYTARMRTPRYTRLNDQLTELHEKSFYSVTTFFAPKGNYTANLEVQVDRRTQSFTVSLQGGGALLDTFLLNTDTLGGGEFEYVETPIEDRGRAIQLEWSQAGSNQDLEVYGYAIRVAAGEGHALESS